MITFKFVIFNVSLLIQANVYIMTNHAWDLVLACEKVEVITELGFTTKLGFMLKESQKRMPM